VESNNYRQHFYRFCGLFVAFFCVFFIFSFSIYAENSLCSKPQQEQKKIRFISSENTQIDAGFMEKIGTNLYLSDNVRLLNEKKNLYADKITIKQKNDNSQYKLTGNVKILDNKMFFETQNAFFYPSSDRVQVSRANFKMNEKNLRGFTTSIYKESPNITVLNDAMITSCPPQKESWVIKGSTIKLDDKEEEGSVTHFRLQAGDVPVFYLPYFRFPLTDKRKSGFLYPSFGYDDRSGFITEIPYYLNILPNLDDTITAKNYAKRGLMAKNELRLLLPFGKFQLDNEYLQKDKLTGEKRQFSHFEQKIDLTKNMWLETNYSSTSDMNYFADFGNSLSLSQLTHLEQRTDVNLKEKNITVRLRYLDYQTLDESISLSDQPYQLKPEFLFSYDGRFVNLFALYSNFYKRNTADVKRTVFKPQISYSFQSPGYFIRPQLTLFNINYTKKSYNNNQNDTNKSISVPITSFDTGLMFDNYLSTDTQLTLEPRLFFVHSPFVLQDDINIYDTSERIIDISSLYQINRFIGYDRVQDTRQVSFSLSHKRINLNSASQIYDITVGQIFYFKDREVTMPNADSPQKDKSDVLTAMNINYPKNWSYKIYNQYNQEQDINRKSTFDMQYKPDESFIFNVGFSEEHQIDRQINLSASIPVSNKWQLFARTNRSLLHDRELTSMLGVEHKSCCYKLQSIFSRNLNINTQEKDYKFYFLWTLTGISNIGNNTQRLLGDNIAGYR
jgi:LPS-assembly protein